MADDVATDEVTVAQMQEYLNLDGDDDTVTLKLLIDAAEEDARGNVDENIPIEEYRKYKQFNQAVRVLVDFNYYNRGNLATTQLAYPPSYLFMINSFRWKIRRAENEDSNQSS